MTEGFYYLASPYSKFPGGIDAAYEAACKVAAECFAEGLLVFSPIAHTHSIAKIGGFGGGFDVWRKYDLAMMQAAQGLIVAKLPGWRESEGVAAEIKWFADSKRPIIYRDVA